MFLCHGSAFTPYSLYVTVFWMYLQKLMFHPMSRHLTYSMWEFIPILIIVQPLSGHTKCTLTNDDRRSAVLFAYATDLNLNLLYLSISRQSVAALHLQRHDCKTLPLCRFWNCTREGIPLRRSFVIIICIIMTINTFFIRLELSLGRELGCPLLLIRVRGWTACKTLTAAPINQQTFRWILHY